MNFNFKPWHRFHFSEMTSLPSKLTVRSFLRGNFPLWPCECFALQLSSVTERWKMPPHQEQNVGNYFLLWKIIIPPTEIKLQPTFKHRQMKPGVSLGKCGISPFVSVFLVLAIYLCRCDAASLCACEGVVHARGLLIGLIRQSCCTAPERIILLLPSFFVCFALMFSKCYDLYPEHHLPSLSPLTSAVLLRSYLGWARSCRSSKPLTLLFLSEICAAPPDLSFCPLCVTAIPLPH